MKKFIQLSKGMATYIPGLYALIAGNRHKTSSARYCYSVWLRHLCMAYKSKLSTKPAIIAELGPGNSLGTGLAALISGASEYYAFDIVADADQKRNLEVLDELIDLFKKREKIPDEKEFPRLKPCLDSYKFPNHILSDEHLNWALQKDRVDSMKNILLNWDAPNANNNNIKISYCVPWYGSDIIKRKSVDMIFSQAVLEHVDDLAYTYDVLYQWLKPGAFMSHVIDFKSHGTAKKWNGHWAYSDFVWKLIRGKRPYMINRQPYASHIELLQKHNYKVVHVAKIKDYSGIPKEELALSFNNISDDDLTTSGVFLQALRPE